MEKLQILKTQKELRLHSNQLKSEMVKESKNLQKGHSFTNQLFHEFYTYKDYRIGVSKPGKEVFSENIKYKDGLKSNNPHDMTPTILKGGEKIEYDGSFSAIFKEFVKLYNSKNALHVLGALLVRNAYLLDHQKIGSNWRYSPPQDEIEYLNNHCSDFLGMPILVFLYYIELIAVNEDTKYTTLGYDISQGFGRKNNLLTYAHIVMLLSQKHNQDEGEFLVSFLGFAGRLSSPPVGLNPISLKKAREYFGI
jgi:hypothetical protein